MKNLVLLLLCASLFSTTFAQSNKLLSPADFLGYEVGTKFTRHHQVVEYFKYVADNHSQVQFFPYGKSFEGRPLVAVAISSVKNINALESIRKGHLSRIGLSDAKAFSDKEPTLVWLSYNIHGDEAVSSEAALVTLEKLSSNDAEVQKWLEDVIVIMDPCLNPDGRDRYVNWYNNVAMAQLNIDQNSEEHHSTWPGGRVNHYLFDLNRDWAWQVQVESQQRGEFYQQWMPHVHVDFHEMGINSPYFFAPAAHPIHENITPWQRDFQELVGSNHAGYFDDAGWTFYTKEFFDLFYPSYGDTWPIFNGAMGFTYEQGGSRDAGVAVLNDHGDTLTLKDRVEHHYTTSLSTIEVSYLNREKLKKEFKKYFTDAANTPLGEHKSYVIKGSNDPSRVNALLSLLDKQKIRYGTAPNTRRSYNGFDYLNNKNGSFTLESGDIVVSAYQPKSVLLKVLFEPKSMLEDSMTYDLTAWALPYVYEVETYATSERIDVKEDRETAFTQNPLPKKPPVAYLVEWKDVQDVKLLSALLKENIKVRFAEKNMTLAGKSYTKGTLVITRAHNKNLADFDAKVVQIANAHQQPLDYARTGMADSGPDLGAEAIRYIKRPKVALVNGEGVNPNAYGELWHYFDQDLEYPISVVNMSYANRINWNDFDVVVLPSGRYSKIAADLMKFVSDGGKVIAIEGAIRIFSGKETALASAIEAAEKKADLGGEDLTSKLRRYEDSERSYLSGSVAGSIYKVHLDDSHPLAFGEDGSIHIMKRNSSTYPFLDNGWNVGVIKDDGHVSGFIGSQLKRDLVNSLVIGTESHGGGQLVYFTDSPVFRGFWHSGKLLLGNAVFFVGQ